MTQLYLWVFGSFVAGLVLAVSWWVGVGRKRALPPGAVSCWTLAAGLFVLLGALALRVVDAGPILGVDLPAGLSSWYWDYRFAVLPAVGLVGSTFLLLPVRARGGRGTADLARRSFVSFVHARWFLAPAVVLSVIVLLTVVAGAASQPDDETGRSTRYVVELGTDHSMATIIYGWFFSVPALTVVALLLVVTVLGMSLVARPALADDREQDISVRTARTRTMIVASTGTLLLHLGQVLASLAGTASMRGEFATSVGRVRSWTTFSALEPALLAASLVSAALGIALWGVVALSGVPSRRRVPVDA